MKVVRVSSGTIDRCEIVLRLLFFISFGLLICEHFFAAEDLTSRRSAIVSRYHAALGSRRSTPHEGSSLTFVTLIYADWTDRRSFEQNIAHNCRVIRDAPGSHSLLVYTDLPHEPYCSVCTCVRFERTKCICPGGGCNDGNSFCEKVYFLVDRIRELREFVFLDRDFIILKEAFVTRLAARARVHDMLIAYDHTHLENYHWRKQINSGLFFIRRLNSVNYSELIPAYYEIGDNDDQPVVGRMMFEQYDNYDILSHQFHCRFITDKIQFPPSLCLALHDRGDEAPFFKRVGFRMRMINGTKYDKFSSDDQINVLPYTPVPLPPVGQT